jgi:hypothetical protein
MSVEQTEQYVPVSESTPPVEAGTAYGTEVPAEPTPEIVAPSQPLPEPVAPVQPLPEPEAPKAAPPRTETEVLDPEPIKMVLKNGIPFDLHPLKLRQFLRLLRIVTRGASDMLDNVRFDFDDPDAFMSTFLGIVLFSIPDAEEEAVDFVKSVVKPSAGSLTGNQISDGEKINALYLELDNPELEDMLTIIQALIEREAEDLRALGKRLAGMFEMAQKMGATKKNANVRV